MIILEALDLIASQQAALDKLIRTIADIEGAYSAPHWNVAAIRKAIDAAKAYPVIAGMMEIAK